MHNDSGSNRLVLYCATAVLCEWTSTEQFVRSEGSTWKWVLYSFIATQLLIPMTVSYEEMISRNNYQAYRSRQNCLNSYLRVYNKRNFGHFKKLFKQQRLLIYLQAPSYLDVGLQKLEINRFYRHKAALQINSKISYLIVLKLIIISDIIYSLLNALMSNKLVCQHDTCFIFILKPPLMWRHTTDDIKCNNYFYELTHNCLNVRRQHHNNPAKSMAHNRKLNCHIKYDQK